MHYSHGYDAPKWRIGCALQDKKIVRYVTEDIKKLAAHHGIELSIINIHEPLEAQGPFTAILHKLVGNPEWEAKLKLFAEANPEVVLLDQPDSIRPLLNRQTMLSSLGGEGLAFRHPEVAPGDARSSGTARVEAPKQIIISKDMTFEEAVEAVEAAGLRPPLLVKPMYAVGRDGGHSLALLQHLGALRELMNASRRHSRSGRAALTPPLVLQQFVEHGGVLFKVYVLGWRVVLARRPSLQLAGNSQAMKKARLGLLELPRISCNPKGLSGTATLRRASRSESAIQAMSRRASSEAGEERKASAAAASTGCLSGAAASPPPMDSKAGSKAALPPSTVPPRRLCRLGGASTSFPALSGLASRGGRGSPELVLRSDAGEDQDMGSMDAGDSGSDSTEADWTAVVAAMQSRENGPAESSLRDNPLGGCLAPEGSASCKGFREGRRSEELARGALGEYGVIEEMEPGRHGDLDGSSNAGSSDDDQELAAGTSPPSLLGQLPDAEKLRGLPVSDYAGLTHDFDPPQWLLEELARTLRERSGLQMFNLDIICPADSPACQPTASDALPSPHISPTNGLPSPAPGDASHPRDITAASPSASPSAPPASEPDGSSLNGGFCPSGRDLYHVVDINYFPGFDKLDNFEQLWVDFLHEACMQR